MYYIGIDLGTSSVKLLLLDTRTGVKKTVSREYPLYFPKPNFCEQNPDDWWKAVCEGVEEIISGIEKSDVKGIGTGGQMHGLVMLDENGFILRNAILWNDTRTGRETNYLNNVIGKELGCDSRTQAQAGEPEADFPDPSQDFMTRTGSRDVVTIRIAAPDIEAAEDEYQDKIDNEKVAVSPRRRKPALCLG